MPVLQLVGGMLAALGPKHSTAAQQVTFISFSTHTSTNHSLQVLDFLSSHRDTIIILLKSEDDYVPLSLVDEIHLLVSLCAAVFPLIPKTELVSSMCNAASTKA